MLVSLRNTIGSSLTLPFEPTTKALVLVSVVAFTVFATVLYCTKHIIQRCWKQKDGEGDEVNKLGNNLLNKDSNKIEEKKLGSEANKIAEKIDPSDEKNLNEVNAEENKTNDLKISP